MNSTRNLLFLLLSVVSLTISNSYAEPTSQTLIEAARAQIGKTTEYDGSYQKLDYPGGDIDISRGVCTDVVIRAYRSLGYDLQKLLHEDIRTNFGKYPSKRIWGLKKPDRNIDHRRVPNLRHFFERKAEFYPTRSAHERTEPKPGDLLTWMLPGNLPHIGIVSNKKSEKGNYLIIHNIGRGTQEEDMIDSFKLTGHYRYQPWKY